MTLRVLSIEDSPTDTKLMIRALGETGRAIEFERVEDAEAMRDALARKKWDLVISDWSMPKFTAPAALAILKQMDLDLPFIIVSGTIGEEMAVAAMRAGAHDYVLKDQLKRLAPAVERELRECTDRAARRQAEAALRQSEFLFRRLAESGMIGIIVSDGDGKVLDANSTYLDMIGYSHADMRAGLLRWSDYTSPEFAAHTTDIASRLRRTGFAPAWEMEVVKKDGTRVPILAGAALLDVPRSIAFTVDLTERKRAEAGRERAEEALRLSEAQLRQTQKMEAVGRLAGGVAHDFNNVLSVILSYAELMLDDLKDADPLRSDIAEIRKAALRAAGLTRQLLLFSRQQVVEAKVLDLNELLSSMGNMVERILGEDVELVSVSAPNAARVWMDPSHIEQVILNLVVNARDAMPVGGKLTVETACVHLDDDYARSHLLAKVGPHVMLAVTDTGSGMDLATQARLFEPFFTTKDAGKGTGLGLCTVFGIVQRSGGSIDVHSEVGKGTSFKVYLPRAAAEHRSIRPHVSPSTLRGSETILLVEDEEQVRTIAANILRKQGYTVLAAQNGIDAIAMCEAHDGPIALLVTDVVMPRMSGPELAKRLTATRPEIKVLCVSGYNDEIVVRHGAIEDGIAFLQKPITPIALATKVREVLDERN